MGIKTKGELNTVASNTFTLFEDYKEAKLYRTESPKGRMVGIHIVEAESKPDHKVLSALLQMVSLPKCILLLMDHKDYIFLSVIWIRCGHKTCIQ